MEEFSKDRYGVDVLKVEVPVNMEFVEGTKAYGDKKLIANGGDGSLPTRPPRRPSRSSIFRRA